MTDFIKVVLFMLLYSMQLATFGLLLALVTFAAGNTEAFLIITVSITMIPCTKILFEILK